MSKTYDQEIENEKDYGNCVKPRGGVGPRTGNIVRRIQRRRVLQRIRLLQKRSCVLPRASQVDNKMGAGASAPALCYRRDER
jgi:hypothetical protein